MLKPPAAWIARPGPARNDAGKQVESYQIHQGNRWSSLNPKEKITRQQLITNSKPRFLCFPHNFCLFHINNGRVAEDPILPGSPEVRINMSSIAVLSMILLLQHVLYYRPASLHSGDRVYAVPAILQAGSKQTTELVRRPG
jgi:hypothetical protein